MLRLRRPLGSRRPVCPSTQTLPHRRRPCARPPAPTHAISQRPFSQTTSPLHLPLTSTTSTPTRPQLPFMTTGPENRALPPLSIHLRQHFFRLISTERRNYYKRQISGGLRLGLTGCVILVLFQLVQEGIHQGVTEHRFPTPGEWSWRARWGLREGLALQSPEKDTKNAVVNVVNWVRVAGFLRGVIELLENPDGDGKGIVEQGEDGSGFLVEGVGKTGLDIEAKSEQWRRGYFQALIGAAKAAEHLEGWVTDTKARVSAPKEYVEGPSNPRPKPLPVGAAAAVGSGAVGGGFLTKKKLVLREENCEPASPSPDSFYMKILTTKGFSTAQKVEAALAYADWLDFKGLQRTAGDMYRWAMDIATDGLPRDASKVVDTKTGVLKNNGQDLPSNNVLRVSTALAVHQARQGNIPEALSIFTSVLKARRSLPSPSLSSLSTTLSDGSTRHDHISIPKSSQKAIYDPVVSFFHTMKLMFTPVEYPSPPPSGNDPPLRTASSLCEEAGLMTYIGEIIFASSSKETGLAWTRDAVDLAESTLLDPNTPQDLDASISSSSTPAHQRCTQCLKVGLENWKTMVRQLVRQAEDAELKSLETAKTSWSWSWLGSSSQSKIQSLALERKRWEAEEKILSDRIRKVWHLVDEEAGAFEGYTAPNSLFG